MSIVNALISSIARYGGDITVTSNGSTVRGRAIVEPLRYRNKIYIGGEQRHLGFVKREKYLFIGTTDFDLTENHSVIESVSGKYIVKRCERYYVQDRPIYTWAILVPFGERREDDYDADSGTD